MSIKEKTEKLLDEIIEEKTGIKIDDRPVEAKSVKLVSPVRVFIITYAITFNKDFSKIRELLANNFERVLFYIFNRDRCRIFKSMSQSVSILKFFNKDTPNKKEFIQVECFRETPDINNIEIINYTGYLLPKGTKYSQSHRLPKNWRRNKR